MNSLETKKEMVSLRVPIDVNKKLTKHVKKIGISKNAFVLTLVLQELDKTISQRNKDKVSGKNLDSR